MQITGDEAANPCNKCLDGCGKFKACVVSSDCGHNACGNCHYNSEGTSCSFRKADATPAKAAKRLKKDKEVVVVSDDEQEVDDGSKSVAGSCPPVTAVAVAGQVAMAGKLARGSRHVPAHLTGVLGPPGQGLLQGGRAWILSFFLFFFFFSLEFHELGQNNCSTASILFYHRRDTSLGFHGPPSPSPSAIYGRRSSSFCDPDAMAGATVVYGSCSSAYGSKSFLYSAS